MRIGYFGGSITEGAGASDAAQTSWRALTTAWFEAEFPDAQIHEISAALGGTGSMLGAFRLHSDLLRFQPDLIFVEFAVNDDLRADDLDGARQRSRALEGIARHIKRELPACEIVFVYTLTKSMARELGDDGLSCSTRLHETIARHYQIPAVNVGQALLEQIAAGAGDWEFYTIDSVHPNDAGYQIYAATLIDALREMRANGRESSPPFPAALDAAAWENGQLIGADSLCASGWTIAATAPATMTAEWHPARYATRFLVADAPETKLRVQFSGSVVGLFYLIAPDSGDLEFSIDGAQPAQFSMWDKYAHQFTRPNYRILADDLAPGHHELELRILQTNNESSTGTCARLLALLVNS